MIRVIVITKPTVNVCKVLLNLCLQLQGFSFHNLSSL